MIEIAERRQYYTYFSHNTLGRKWQSIATTQSSNVDIRRSRIVHKIVSKSILARWLKNEINLMPSWRRRIFYYKNVKGRATLSIFRTWLECTKEVGAVISLFERGKTSDRNMNRYHHSYSQSQPNKLKHSIMYRGEWQPNNLTRLCRGEWG